jgi:hypothetical protein
VSPTFSPPSTIRLSRSPTTRAPSSPGPALVSATSAVRASPPPTPLRSSPKTPRATRCPTASRMSSSASRVPV